MNPYYTGYIANYKLGEYDSKLIQDLYGANPSTTTTTKPTTTTTKPTTKKAGSQTTPTTRHSAVTTTRSTINIPDLPIKLYCLTSKKATLISK